MESSCDFCSAQRGLVYCNSDAARLCLPCDAFIHSANAISRRHHRALICDLCLARPASVRCLDDRISFCQSCELAGPEAGGCGPSHRHRHLSCYSGCPSPHELSAMWSSLLDLSDSTLLPLRKTTMTTTNQNCDSRNSLAAGEAASTVGRAGVLGVTKFHPRVAIASSISPIVSPESSVVLPCGSEQQGFFHNECNPPKMRFPASSNLGTCDNDELCKGFSTGIAGFHFQDGTEALGRPQNNTTSPFHDTGSDDFITDKNLSGHIESALIETSPTVQHDCMTLRSPDTFQLANAGQPVNGNSNRSDNPILHIGNICTTFSLSLSNLTGESSADDHEDCGVSPMFLTGESTWDSNPEPGHRHLQERNEAKMTYNEKNRSRTFGKSITYASRKVKDDTRKRMKGGFVKADETCDFDPCRAGSS
ncbi:unnamed protein product [Musa hybrid cultivar]